MPASALAFEYQGEQHFKPLGFFDDPKMIQQRDQEKRLCCAQIGFSLIEIPYWWDKSDSSLLATIHKHRPDIVKDPGHALPIPELAP